MGNEKLTPWVDNVAFVYRQGLRGDDKGKPVIIGCWDGDAFKNPFEIREDVRLSDLQHRAINWLNREYQKQGGS